MFKSSPLLLPFPQALCFLFAIKLGTQSCGLPGMLAYSPLKLVSPWSPLASFLPVPLASLLSLGFPFLLTNQKCLSAGAPALLAQSPPYLAA